MARPRQSSWWVALWLLAAVAGCARDDRQPIRIGIAAWPGYEFLYLARERGFFAAEGVDVRIVEFGSMSDVARAYDREQLDGYTVTTVELLQTRAHSDRRPQAVLVLDESAGADVILARPPYRSVADLRGRRIGLELGSLNIVVLSHALERAGMGLHDVQLAPMDATAFGDALARGELDAVVAYPPVSLAITAAHTGSPVFSSRDIPGEIVDVLALEHAFIERRPTAVQAIARAYARAIAFAAGDPDQAYAIMAARERISPAEFRQTIDEGVCLVGSDAQAPYFGPQGSLRENLASIDERLHRYRQIDDDSEIESAVADLLPIQARAH